MCKGPENNAWHMVSAIYELLATLLPVAADMLPGLGTPMGEASFALRSLTPQPGRLKPCPCLAELVRVLMPLTVGRGCPFECSAQVFMGSGAGGPFQMKSLAESGGCVLGAVGAECTGLEVRPCFWGEGL